MDMELPQGFLSETEHPPSTLALHAHATASFCLVTRGVFRERSPRGERLLGRDDVIFRLPQERHSNKFPSVVRCFNVHVEPDLILDGTPQLAAAGPVLRRLLGRSRQGANTLTLEGLLLQLVGETFQAPPARRSIVVEARRIIDARFTEPLTVRSIAAELCTHPVHLARTFRRQERRGIGEAIRALRLEYAKQLLRNGETSLAEIATASGFADQSHFTKVFRQATGQTPGAFSPCEDRGRRWPKAG